jgi:hypothetical protein
MKPDDVSTAITQALIQGGAQWLVATLVAFLPALWTMTLFMHLGRPYVLRTLRRCGLRLGADIWWMSYLLTRDAVLVLTFAVSWIFFLPNFVATAAFPITGPLAALCLLLALAVKISRRVDDDAGAYRLSTIFLVLGATFYYVPLVFAVEAGSQVNLVPVMKYLVSSTNPMVSLYIMWASLIGVTAVLGWLFMRALASANRSMARRGGAPTAVRTAEPARVA